MAHHHVKRDISMIPKPIEIYDQLSDYLIGQEKAKKVVSTAIYYHLMRVYRFGSQSDKIATHKNNILMVGPTGSGKTYMARVLAKILDLPLVIVDITPFTEAGYYGRNIEEIITELTLLISNRIDEMPMGIVFIDEVDKIAQRGNIGANSGSGRDVGGLGVQQALLKLLEGTEALCPVHTRSDWSQGLMEKTDISRILFICAGAFSGIEEIIQRQMKSEYGTVGFAPQNKTVQKNEILQHISTKALVEYGMIPEFLSRLPIVTVLHEIDENLMIKILKESKDSLLKHYQEMLNLLNVKLRFEEDALKEIVKVACHKKLGARALKSVFEEVMMDIMFRAPSENKREIAISRKWVKEHLGFKDETK